MKKHLLLFLLNIVTIGLFAQTTAIQPQNWTNGTGGEISNLAELRWLSENPLAWDEDWELTNNIDASETSTWNWVDSTNTYKGFSPIGDYEQLAGELAGHRQHIPFTGRFDGNFFTISNLTINRINENYCRLFGFIIDAEIHKLNIVNINVKGTNFVGGIVAHTWGIIMNYCTVKDSEITAQLNSTQLNSTMQVEF